MLYLKVIIANERYGDTTDFPSVEAAQKAVRECGPEFASTTFRRDGAWIIDDRGETVGTYTEMSDGRVVPCE